MNSIIIKYLSLIGAAILGAAILMLIFDSTLKFDILIYFE